MRPPWIRVTSASTWLLSCAAKRSSTSIPTTAAAVAPGTRADAIRYKALSKVANTGGATAPLAVCERGSRAGSSSTCTGRERRETIAPCALTTANRSGCGESTAPAARKARSSGRPGDWPSPPRTASIRSGIIATARGARRASSRSICPRSAVLAAATRARIVSSPVWAMLRDTRARLMASASATSTVKIQIRALMQKTELSPLSGAVKHCIRRRNRPL